MKLLYQSNRWSCLVNSFAMVTDTLPTDVYVILGHDGSAILWPQYPEPYSRRSFHIDEMIDYCLSLGRYPVHIQALPSYRPDRSGASWQQECFPFSGREHQRLISHLRGTDAVLLGRTKQGKPHAVAWCHKEQKVFDPEGFKYPIDEFNVTSAYLLL